MFVLWLTGTRAVAEPLILMSENSALYRLVAEEIRRSAKLPLALYSTENIPSQERLDQGLNIAIGARACEQLLQHSGQADLICTLVPRSTFESLSTLYDSGQRRISAVYLDQPLQRQLRLARLLVPNAKSIGTMFGPFSNASMQMFDQASLREKLTPLSITLDEADNPIERLTPLIQQSDVFLALPDRALFNRSTAKWLLYITLQQKVPVIGFSKTYVEAGALAAVYSTPAQIGQQTGELLRELDLSQPLPPPTYPKYYNVSSNPIVARTLELPEPDDQALYRQLEGGSK
uniref:ABC transporter substrate-binding protein n=1 Tax=Marinobacterium profundum TaxID=1714300 RepID=UPI00082D9FFE|nr:ABC transporter substrate binding protein [Marinobacterium profundum]